MYKLMIVDDELLMRVGIRSMLDWEEQGFRLVGEAGNGKEALELAVEASPDLIITDIKMPIMDGLQLIREAAIALKTCKYVILSNFDELHYVKEALKLGASDYLIKSEITTDTLVELLTSMRQKLQADHASLGKIPVMPYDVSQSLSHLKENFFNDLVSGFISEKDAVAKAEELHFGVGSRKLAVMKFIVNHYEDVKKKYVEKGEKLLRFSILNIMEEVIPSKWGKEIIVESSSDYWIMVDASNEEDAVRPDLERLCNKLLASIRDFMNLSLTAGVSTVVSGFGSIKLACHEAEYALQQSFFTGTEKVLFFEDADKMPARQAVNVILNAEQEQEFASLWVSKDEKKARQFLEGLRAELAALQADEKSVRENYIRFMEMVHAHLPGAALRSRLAYAEKSPYETVLKGESWGDIHQGMLAYIGYCFKADSQYLQDCTYSDLAVDMINKYYAEDISLQSVANQINVNPSYLSRMFKQERGENFISYLTRVRIERAKAYLMSGKLMVYEVADKVGYHNCTYFSKIFKKSVGVTPEEYREQRQS